MALTPQQRSELTDKVLHVQRQLAATQAALADIRDTRDELGGDVETFLEPYFTRTQWQTAYNAIDTLTKGLAARIAAAQGEGLDELRRAKTPAPEEER